MLQEALDFGDESENLFRLLSPLDDGVFERTTLFKGWTVNDILTHLHIWNWAADVALHDQNQFRKFIKPAAAAAMNGELRQFESQRYGHLSGRKLLNSWRHDYQAISKRFVDVDPKHRVPWAGPDMSVRSSITARLMETWAHGQAIFDLLGVERNNSDRIKGICVLGINTFGWSFMNSGMEVPDKVPYVCLTAPSGEIWQWNAGANGNKIEGPAVEFCQVVTQSRNVLDTTLQVSGTVAGQWMAIAQCFAGPREDPPAIGSRRTREQTPEEMK